MGEPKMPAKLLEKKGFGGRNASGILLEVVGDPPLGNAKMFAKVKEKQNKDSEAEALRVYFSKWPMRPSPWECQNDCKIIRKTRVRKQRRFGQTFRSGQG